MRYKFNIKLTENDYYDFNEFHMLKSKQTKKSILYSRIIMAVIVAVMCLISLYGGGFTVTAFVRIIPLILFLVLFELLLTTLMRRAIKRNLRSMKKNGKMAFSPEATIEFYEDKFIEETDVNKTEQSYAAIEKVCVITGKVIYIYVSSIQAYLVPAMSFKDTAELDEFVEFIKTKSPVVEYYNK